MLRLIAVLLLAAVPACLLAPPRPGAGGDGGMGGGDAGGDGGDGGGMTCPCGDSPGDSLPAAMVVAGAAAGMPDRLIRAGICEGSVQLLIYEPGIDGRPPRCPTTVVPDLVPFDGSAPITVRALGTVGPDRATVLISGPEALTRVVGVDLTTPAGVLLTTSQVALDPGPAYIAGVPEDGTEPDNHILYGVNSTAWLANMASGPPVSLISPVDSMLPLVVAAPQKAGVGNAWALTGRIGDYEVGLTFPTTSGDPLEPLPAPCGVGGSCTMIGHANEQHPVAMGETASYAISEGGYLTVTALGDQGKRRSQLALQLASAKVVDVAIAKVTGGATWIAVLDDGGVVRAAPVTVTGPASPAVSVGSFATGMLPTPLPAPARVVLGRFGDPLRIYVLSGAPDGGPKQAACLQLSGSTLVPCAP